MSEEYTLADLAADAEVEPDDGGSDSGGSDLVELFEFVDERVGLERMLMSQMDMGDLPEGAGDGAGDGVPTDGARTDGGGSGGADLSAESIAQFGKLVIDEFGDVPVSKVVKFAESNPEQVNEAISEQVDP
jgi:hypothetical protein